MHPCFSPTSYQHAVPFRVFHPLAALTHAALGFLVEESQSKHVLELYATNYVNSFLPELPLLPPTPAPATPAPTPSPTPPPTPPQSAAPTTAPPTGGNGTYTVSPTPSPAGSSSNGTHAPVTPAPATLSPTHVGNGTEFSGVWSEFSGVRQEGHGSGGGSGWQPVGGGGNGTADVTWDNTAALRVTSGFDESMWASANYVGKITGLLFNDISGASFSSLWCDSYFALVHFLLLPS